MSQEPQQAHQQQRRQYNNNYARPRTAPGKQQTNKPQQQGWGNKNQQQYKSKGNKQNGNKRPNQATKTIFIARVFMDDLTVYVNFMFQVLNKFSETKLKSWLTTSRSKE